MQVTIGKTKKVDFVTVTFGQELRLLQLQARSFAKFVPNKIVNQIIIVINEEKTTSAQSLIMELVVPLYGENAKNVRLVSRADLTGDYAFQHRGWYSQQVLKLLIAREVREAGYIILDSKNHFIRPVKLGDFIAENGLLKHRAINVDKKHTAGQWLTSLLGLNRSLLPKRFVGSFAYFGLDARLYASRVVPTVTPFPMYKKVSLALIIAVEEREGCSFPAWFEKYRDATEFYLSHAFMAEKGFAFDEIYAPTSSFTKLIFKQSALLPAEIDRRIAAMDDPNYYSFAVHRAAAYIANGEVKKKIGNFWLKRGLIDTEEEAAYFFSMDLPKRLIE